MPPPITHLCEALLVLLLLALSVSADPMLNIEVNDHSNNPNGDSSSSLSSSQSTTPTATTTIPPTQLSATISPTLSSTVSLKPLSSSIPDHIELKVLPLGDSITEGFRSTDGNGYRLHLQNLIKQGGVSVEFVGTQHSGNMSNNAHEGYGNADIGRIDTNLSYGGILQDRYPNLILIHAGTNDVVHATEVELENRKNINGTITFDLVGDEARLGWLIDYVYCHDPNAVILVAKLAGQRTLLPEQVTLFNGKVESVVRNRTGEGYKIKTVDMRPVDNDYLADPLHPNDKGYELMATIWYQAMLKVPETWWERSRRQESIANSSCLKPGSTFTPSPKPTPTNLAGQITISLPWVLFGLALQYFTLG